jgi:hypothetical protein
VKPFPQTWNIDVLANGRSQLLVLASEEYSLFSVLIPTGRQRNVNVFLDIFRERLLELLENFRIHLAHRPDLNQFSFSRRTDPRIIGSQNDLLYGLRYILTDSPQKPASTQKLRALEEELNSTPLSYLAMDSPLAAFEKKIRQLKGF